uniref:Cupin domain-containing protein n=1 Tax=Roseihalotalea indica TaxID=2867963 RepID=A0AA49GJU1_9BACT|nr:cupin domain-containing protein [Tunicatimonas sp. TK19036]
MKRTLVLIWLIRVATTVAAQEEYRHGPNSQAYEQIPKGTVSQHTWISKIYDSTTQEYYVYVPAQYDAAQPAALMVFQDGHTYVKEDGDFRVPTVFDNLISQGKMPVTIGLFINPGHSTDAPSPESPWQTTNRSLEYDDVSDTYGRFLLEEMIPELKSQYNISDDPKMHAISGISSGGICAFTAAWFYPEQFQKVLSHIGSFTDIRGGHNYPSMIRKNDPKNIKVFLQDGSNDLDNQFGNWWFANLQMEAALKFKGYDYKFAPGTGEHNGQHGGAILPESLAWLWSDVVPPRIASGVYAFPESAKDTVLMQGATTHFSELKCEVRIIRSSESIPLHNQDYEQIFIIKEGEVTVSINNETKTLGPNSVAFLLPGGQGTMKGASSEATYYAMTYRANQKMDLARGKADGGSFMIDFNELKFNEHDRGGIRNYFHRATAMCPYYEMHVTNLNPGIKSHEPHTHAAAELVLMIEGDTEMEIGNQIYRAKPGDVYFLASNVPHAIKNLGNKQCMYFAFQWE